MRPLIETHKIVFNYSPNTVHVYMNTFEFIKQIVQKKLAG